MSREIKFRAWQPHNSLHRQPGMYEVESLVFYEKTKDHPYSGEAFFYYNNGELNSYSSSEYLEDINLMQYTGLKDKDGKEIYEGDIVEYWRYNGESSVDRDKRKVVEWRSTPKNGTGFNITHPANEINWEVIGNIYENPELIK